MSTSDDKRSLLQRFLKPRATKGYLLRLLAVTVCSIIVFGYACPPFFISGSSMDPTYRDGGFVLGFRWLHAGGLERGDIVFVQLAGTRVMYLKRVVAFSGETVSFKDGVLFVNGTALDEPYVTNGCDWNLDERVVKSGRVYVIGDNRSMSIESHSFGQVTTSKVRGGPLW